MRLESTHSFVRKTRRPASWACRAIAAHTPSSNGMNGLYGHGFCGNGDGYVTVEISHLSAIGTLSGACEKRFRLHGTSAPRAIWGFTEDVIY